MSSRQAAGGWAFEGQHCTTHVPWHGQVHLLMPYQIEHVPARDVSFT